MRLEDEITYDELRFLYSEIDVLLIGCSSYRRLSKNLSYVPKLKERFSQFRIQHTIEKHLERGLWHSRRFDEFILALLLPACESQKLIKKACRISDFRVAELAASLIEPDIEEPELDWSKTTGIVWAS